MPTLLFNNLKISVDTPIKYLASFGMTIPNLGFKTTRALRLAMAASAAGGLPLLCIGQRMICIVCNNLPIAAWWQDL